MKYIVLDAGDNNAEGEHYALGKFDWTKAVVPDTEVAWLKKELASGKEPVIVFMDQLLNWTGTLIPCRRTSSFITAARL
ncbi:MAG: hypothetical protein V8R49_10470 [Duodenibacillus massiliensis]